MTKPLSKAEKRLIRRNDKLVKQKDKCVRLSSNIVLNEKYIRIDVAPELVKSPRASSPSNYKECNFLGATCIQIKKVIGHGRIKSQEHGLQVKNQIPSCLT